jgi:hypothetical protein
VGYERARKPTGSRASKRSGSGRSTGSSSQLAAPLQRTAGNNAVAALLQRKADASGKLDPDAREEIKDSVIPQLGSARTLLGAAGRNSGRRQSDEFRRSADLMLSAATVLGPNEGDKGESLVVRNANADVTVALNEVLATTPVKSLQAAAAFLEAAREPLLFQAFDPFRPQIFVDNRVESRVAGQLASAVADLRKVTPAATAAAIEDWSLTWSFLKEEVEKSPGIPEATRAKVRIAFEIAGSAFLPKKAKAFSAQERVNAAFFTLQGLFAKPETSSNGP